VSRTVLVLALLSALSLPSQAQNNTVNTAYGGEALANDSTGNENCAFGFGALAGNTTGFDNTAIGYGALNVNTSGEGNTACGSGALETSTGSFNTAIGGDTGYYSGGSYNIYLGALVIGLSSDNNTIRIGTPYNSPLPGTGQNQTFIAGIVENVFASGSSPSVVGITSDGRLGTVPAAMLPQGPQGPQGPAGDTRYNGTPRAAGRGFSIGCGDLPQEWSNSACWFHEDWNDKAVDYGPFW